MTNSERFPRSWEHASLHCKSFYSWKKWLQTTITPNLTKNMFSLYRKRTKSHSVCWHKGLSYMTAFYESWTMCQEIFVYRKTAYQYRLVYCGCMQQIIFAHFYAGIKMFLERFITFICTSETHLYSELSDNVPNSMLRMSMKAAWLCITS